MPTFIGTPAGETIDGTENADEFYGQGGNDLINGLGGDDVFYWTSGEGQDTWRGGAGTDTAMIFSTAFFGSSFSVTSNGTAVTVQPGGTPAVFLQDFERLNIYLSAQPGDPRITLGDLGSLLTGQIYVNATAYAAARRVVIDGGASHNDLVLLGHSGIDGLLGGSGADQLFGYEGNDSLNGGAGIDTMIGGLGDDSYVLDSIDESVVELAGEGIDSVRTYLGKYTLPDNLENLDGINDGFIGIGNAAANRISGQAGAYLIGLEGDDVLASTSTTASTLQGGVGDDTYLVASLGDSVVEFAGEGVDSIIVTNMTSYTLRSNVENLKFTPPDNFMVNGQIPGFTGTGNALDNEIHGWRGQDILRGGDGNDLLSGQGGIDQLFGEGGNDLLYGSAGQDDLTGGAGADHFIVAAADGADLVRDFSRAEGDKFDVSDLMRPLGGIGDDPFGTGVLAVQSVASINGSGQPGYQVMFDSDGSAGPATAVAILNVLGTTEPIQSDFII
jgi:Ca2+-binding RTX toxin-like protein